MVKGSVISLRYEAGYYALTNGHKGYERSHYSPGGGYVNQRGYGWASECKGSKYILEVAAGGEIYEVWVDRFFKDNLGRLTEKRRFAIEQTIPEFIGLEMHEGRNCGTYCTAAEADMQEWLSRVFKYL